MTLLTGRRLLSRTKTLEFLGERMEKAVEKSRSLYLSPGQPRTQVETSLREISTPPDIIPELAKLIESSTTGAALFRSPEGGFLVFPPFPLSSDSSHSSVVIEPLQAILEHHYTIAFILVRLGSYAVGVSEGENLLSSKVGTGLVHGRHRKGGSSAHRFERHRDKQIEYFLTRVCQHAREHLQPREKALDYIVYGGAWTTIELLHKQCPFLERLDVAALPPLLDIPEPRQPVLKTAVSRVFSSTFIEWQDD
ncbi:Vms1/Ankzf1 family peptidyl-tRNA hydrolase [Chloroflexota bacterium]